MRILHTSDWHLGKKLFRLDRTEEHQIFLDWLLQQLKDKKIDVLLIAGDIFDTPTPPHQSLEMFYEFLHKVSTQTETQTYIIAGNHDSGLLLEAPSKLLRPHRVKIWGKLSQNTEDHWIRVKCNEEVIDLCAIPFFRSYELLPNGEGDPLETLGRYLTKEKTFPQVLMLHHLAGKFEESGSEQVISLSGVDSIPNESFQSFDYVALGHIHKPQRIGPKAYYSGSPIAMRFSETISKSLIMINTQGSTFEVEKLEIPCSRKLYIVKTDEKNWRNDLENIKEESPLTPMIEIQIKLDQPVIGLINEIKERIQEKGMELLSYLPEFAGIERSDQKNQKLFELSPLEIFEEFYKFKFPESKEIPPDLNHDFKELIQKVSSAADQT